MKHSRYQYAVGLIKDETIIGPDEPLWISIRSWYDQG